jgi:hypothetical protein
MGDRSRFPVLVPDQPSSGLHAASEELVLEALVRLIQGKR